MRPPHGSWSAGGQTPQHDPSFGIASDEASVSSYEPCRMDLRRMAAEDICCFGRRLWERHMF